MDANLEKRDEFAKLTTWDRVSYGFGDFAQNLVFGTVGGFLLFYLTNINGISAGVGATIFLVVRWINVVWDPWVGTVVDKAKITKNGKYRPFLLNFGIPLVILAALLFLPVAKVLGSGSAATVAYATVSYMATALVYSFVNIPYGSLNASLTRDEMEVSKLTSVRMMLANVGNLLVYTLFPLFVQLASPNAKMTDTGLFGLKLKLGNYAAPSAAGAWFKVYGIYMVIGAVALFIAYRNTKERVLASEESTDQVKYSDLFAELKRNAALRNLGIFFTFLSIFIIGQLLLFAWSKNPSSDWLGFTGRFLQQWGLTSATGFMWALVPEVVSNGEYISGKRVAGIINAIMGLFFKIGLALGGIIPGYLLQIMHFKSGALTQTASAQFGITLSMIWLPSILAVVAMIVISRYPLSDAYVDKMNQELKEKNS